MRRLTNLQNFQHKQNKVNVLSLLFLGPILSATLIVSGCGGNEHAEEHGDSHEVYAVDKVEEAAELARANAPQPEVIQFDEIDETNTPGANVSTDPVSTATTSTATASTETVDADTQTDANTSTTTDQAITEQVTQKEGAATNADPVTKTTVVPESKPMLTGDTAQAADAAAEAVQQAK